MSGWKIKNLACDLTTNIENNETITIKVHAHSEAVNITVTDSFFALRKWGAGSEKEKEVEQI